MSVIALTKANFKQTIEANNLVFVDYWAPWCEPCLTFTDTFKAVAERHPDILFATVDIEQETEIAEYFNVEKIPAVMVVREQAVILAQVGELGDPALEEVVKWSRERNMDAVHEHYKQEAEKTKS